MYGERRVIDLVSRLLPGAVVAGVRPVAPSADRPPSVYKVMLGSGKVIAVKIAPGSSPGSVVQNTIATEATVLGRLGSLGCNTPRVVGFDATLGALATEWLEGPTLERNLSAGGPNAVDVEQLMREFLAIEVCLDSARKGLGEARSESARNSLVRETESVFESVRSAARAMAAASGRSPSTAEDAAVELQQQICAGLWTVGSRDYNASNIVLCPRGPFFVDFSGVGADWPERRAVGYLIATGAGRKGGNFVAALDQRGARIYDRLGAAVWEGHAAGASLDAHFLAAVLYSIERLRSALTTPGQPESRALLETWLNPNERLSRLNYLARTPLYPNPTADRLRSALG